MRNGESRAQLAAEKKEKELLKLEESKFQRLKDNYKTPAMFSLILIPTAIGANASIMKLAPSTEGSAIANALSRKQAPIKAELATLQTADSLGINGVVKTVDGKSEFVSMAQQISAKQAELKTMSTLTPYETTSAKMSNQFKAGVIGGVGGFLVIACTVILASKRLERFANNLADFCANKHMAVADYFAKNKTAKP